MNGVGTRRIGKVELLQWAEALSGLPCPRLEDLRSGIVLAKLMQTVFPKLRRGNLKWNPKFDWEVNFNWDAIGNMAQVIGLPHELFFEREGLKAGRFRPLYNFLVTLYFLHQVATDVHFNADFVHPIDGVVAQFLQSRSAIDSMVAGGACEGTPYTSAPTPRLTPKSCCSYPLSSPSSAGSAPTPSPAVTTRTTSPVHPLTVPPAGTDSPPSAPRLPTSNPVAAAAASGTVEGETPHKASSPSAGSSAALAEFQAAALAAFEQRIHELRQAHEHALLEARARFERELHLAPPPRPPPAEVSLHEEVGRLRSREVELLRLLQRSQMDTSTALARAAVMQRALQRAHGAPHSPSSSQSSPGPLPARSLSCPMSVDGQLRNVSFQMRAGETVEAVAREMVAGLGLGGGAQAEAAVAASIRSAHQQAGTGSDTSRVPAPGSVQGLPSLYHRAAAYIVEEEDISDDDSGEEAAVEMPASDEDGVGGSGGTAQGEKSPLPFPRTNMLPVEEPGADDFLFYRPGEPRTPVASPTQRGKAALA